MLPQFRYETMMLLRYWLENHAPASGWLTVNATAVVGACAPSPHAIDEPFAELHA